MEFDEDRQAN